MEPVGIGTAQRLTGFQPQVNLSYQFTTDMHPQDITLNLALLLESFEGRLVTVTAYNDTISIIEAPTSLLDPQMYAYPQPPLSM